MAEGTSGSVRRPLYSYFLVFCGVIMLLGALFRPVAGAASRAPGAVADASGVLTVDPYGPLARAGAATGDRWITGETVQQEPPSAGDPRALRWRGNIPRRGSFQVRRGGQILTLEVSPAPPRRLVRLAWGLLALANLFLVGLAIALFWQRPRDGRAVLLGLVLLLAPVFAFPGEPRLLTVVLCTHFLAVMTDGGELSRRARFYRAIRLYLPFVLLGLFGSAIWEGGNPALGGAVFDLTAGGYAAFGLALVLNAMRRTTDSNRPLLRTLAVAAGAVLAALLLGAFHRLWMISDQFVPANLAPGLIFAGATGHLVLRLRAFEVRVLALRTLQYLLTRWVLGGLFLVPASLLVFHLGQLSVLQRKPAPQTVLVYVAWMFLAALLLLKRADVLRGIERRFFRDERQGRETLAGLAADLAELSLDEQIFARIETGVAQALSPESIRLRRPEEPRTGFVELSLPVRHGDRLLARIDLGPRMNGLGYDSEEVRLLRAVAAAAATALENARLSRELLSRQRADLELRSAGLLAGAEEERRRLAADLHDQVLPELRQILVEVERIEDGANGAGPQLRRVAGELRGAMDGVREVMEALRPSALDLLGLTNAIESYLRRTAARADPPITVVVRRSGPEPAPPPEAALVLYRICQEAINNLVRHSNARRAGFEVTAQEEVELVVWDDGSGWDLAPGGGRGLDNMRYRADLIGARVEWARGEKGGTRVTVRWRPAAKDATPALPAASEQVRSQSC